MITISRCASVFFFAMMATSCGPKIKSFTISPVYITPGDTVTVKWDVRGRATLSAWRGSTFDATPAAAEAQLIFLDTLQSSGTKQYQIDETLEMNIIAVKGTDTVYRPQQVWVFPGEPWLDTLPLPTDTLGSDSLIAVETVNLKLPENVLVGEIWLIPARPATVFHKSVMATLIDSAGAHAFDGLPARGEWVIRTARLPEEPFGTGPEELELGIRLYLSHER